MSASSDLPEGSRVTVGTIAPVTHDRDFSSVDEMPVLGI